jgi:hypothetical protein
VLAPDGGGAWVQWHVDGRDRGIVHHPLERQWRLADAADVPHDGVAPADQGLAEMLDEGAGCVGAAVDGRGNVYVNGFGFDFLAGAQPTPGIIALVTPDGTAREVG